MVYDGLLRIRIPSTLSARLETAAEQFARKRSDVVREAVVVHLDRLTRRNNPALTVPEFSEAV